MKTDVILDHEPVADGGFLVRALLRITGDAPPDSDRVPLNISLVLDRSGSMSGPPLRAARTTTRCAWCRHRRPARPRNICRLRSLPSRLAA